MFAVLTVATATAALAVMMFATLATAGPVPKGACPPNGPGFDFTGGPTSWFLATPIGDDARVDRNGDGLICVKAPDTNGNGNSVANVVDYNGAVVKDNNSPIQ
jgi:hypothetical protein